MAEKSLFDDFIKIEEYIDKKHKNDKELKKLISTFKNRLYQLNTTETDDKTNNRSQKDLPGALYNRKSVCYMNALIQALASSNITIKKFQELSVRYPSNANLSLLLALLDNVNGNKESMMSNSEFLSQLVEHMKWTKPSQQDAFDLLATFIEQIEKEFQNVKEDYDLPLKIKILHEFQDKESPNTIQKYLGLSLNLFDNSEKSRIPLEYMINKHFDYSEIDKNSNKITRMSLYEKAPDVLLIHIQANKLDPTTRKLYKPKYSIKYEENMTLYFHIVSSKKGGDPDLTADRVYNTKVKYYLKALIEHSGEISYGHFVTYRKWNDKWYLMNDENAKPIQFDSKICPYIMIYDKDQEDCDQKNNDQKDCDQTNNGQKDCDQTNNDQKDCDQKDCDQTNNDQKDCDQTNNDKKDCDQTNNDQEDCDQTNNDQKGCDQTNNDQKDCDQTNNDQKDCDQTNNDKKDCDQTSNDQKDCDQTSNDQKDCDQTNNDQKGCDQTN